MMTTNRWVKDNYLLSLLIVQLNRQKEADKASFFFTLNQTFNILLSHLEEGDDGRKKFGLWVKMFVESAKWSICSLVIEEKEGARWGRRVAGR